MSNCLWKTAQLYQSCMGKGEHPVPGLLQATYLPRDRGRTWGQRLWITTLHLTFPVDVPGELFCYRIKIEFLSSLEGKWDNASELVEQGFMAGSFSSLTSILTFGPTSVWAVEYLSLLHFELFWVEILTWTGKTFPSTITEYVWFCRV